MYQLGNHCCMWETAILTKCWYLNTVVWLAGKSFAHLTSKAKLTQNIRKSPVVEEVRNLKSAPSVGLWAVASFDVRYLQSSVSTSLSICHLGVMFPDSKREQMPRRLPRLLSIILTTEEEKIDCALSPNSEDGRRGRRYLRLKAQSRAVFNSHTLTSNQNVDPSFSTLQALHEKRICVGLESHAECQHQRLFQNCGGLLVKHSYILFDNRRLKEEHQWKSDSSRISEKL